MIVTHNAVAEKGNAELAINIMEIVLLWEYSIVTEASFDPKACY